MCVFTAAALTAAGTAAAFGTGAVASTGMAAGMTAMGALMADFSIVGTVASTGMSAMGQRQQQRSANAQARYQAQVASNNAITQNRLAENALKTGDIKAQQHQTKVGLLKGRQRSVLASSGVVIDQDSPLETLVDTAGQGTMDVLNIKHEAKTKAWQHRAAAADATGQAGLHLSSQSSPLMAAAPSVLSGATRVADKWYSFTK